MNKEILIFGDIGIDKSKFHYHKNPILIDHLIDKILISNKVSFGKKGYKYYVGYKDDCHKIIPLCIMLPKMKCFFKHFSGCFILGVFRGYKMAPFATDGLIQISVDCIFVHSLFLV